MSPTRIADQHADIAARLKQLTPDPGAATLATKIEPLTCAKCEGGGWVEVYSPSPPQFDRCPNCGNPEGHPSP